MAPEEQKLPQQQNDPSEPAEQTQQGSGAPEGGEKAKTPWQMQKESWYDKVPLSLKQLDIIIGICLTLLALIFLAIALDALGIVDVF